MAEATPIRRRVQREQLALLILLRRYPARLALGSVLYFAQALGYYGLFAFLPLVVLPALHLTPEQLPWVYLAGSIGALLGGLPAAMLLDRWGRFATVTSSYLATALGTDRAGLRDESRRAGAGRRVRAAEPAGYA